MGSTERCLWQHVRYSQTYKGGGIFMYHLSSIMNVGLLNIQWKGYRWVSLADAAVYEEEEGQ